MIDTKLRPYVQKAFDMMAKPLIAAGLNPTQVTLGAGVLGLMMCAFTLAGSFPYRMAAILAGSLSALLDILDGTIARATCRSSALGAFLDLLLDRTIEVCFIMAFVFAFPAARWAGMVFLALVVVNFSTFLLAGNLFANTGEKSFHYEGGLVERSETFILFGLMLVFPGAAPKLLWIFNALMAGTAAYRFIRILRFARANGLDGRTAS